MTDRERLEQFAADMPGDTATYEALAKRSHDLMPNGSRVLYCDPGKTYGDGTVDAKTWGHLRNIARAVQELAFVLGALERGDDPDIPF